MTQIRTIFLIALAMGAGLAPSAHAASKANLTIERIFQSPELDGSMPQGLQFSPHGERLSFLKPKTEDYEVLDLWEFDLASGQERLLVDSKGLKFGELSEAEKARRERMRITRKGIVEYYWSNDGQKIVFPAGGDLYLYKLPDKKLKPLTHAHASELDVKFSPKDSFVSFVRDQNLFLMDPVKSREYRITSDGKGTVSNGVAEFIAQEEMDRFTGYWWSQDEKYLAYTRFDESKVKTVDRYDIDADKITVHKERYPQAGTANANIRLAVVAIKNVRNGMPGPIWVPLGKDPDIYLANADWTSDGHLIFQIESRDQKRLDILSYSPATRKERVLFTETDPHWVNLNKDWKMLKKTPRFIWPSERTGFKHLYLYGSDGRLAHPLPAVTGRSTLWLALMRSRVGSISRQV